MSNKPFDDKAKARLARHIIGGEKQVEAEKSGKACKDCGKGKGDCECQQ
jgi:hypothetical protein